MLLPGRNIIRLAKQLSSVDRLSGGRLLVTFVPGLAEGAERDAIGTPVERRGAVIEEALPLLRQLLSGQPISHEGPLGSFADVTVTPPPLQQPLDMWLGGMARRSLERCGRLGDGWLPSRCTPETASAGRAVIEEAARLAGRTIDPEHFGASIAYSSRPLDELDMAPPPPRAPRARLDQIVPVGVDALRAHLTAFIHAGFSKLVVRPLEPPRSWGDELDTLADGLLDLQC